MLFRSRSGVKRVFIPRDNLDDLRDVADEVKQALEIVPVDTVAEVLLALGMPVASAMPKAM